MDKVAVQKIKFKGTDYILTSPRSNDSPIATISQFQNGKCSFAHFYREENVVLHYGHKIGTSDDIEFGEIIEIEMFPAKFFAGILGDTWSGGEI